MKKKNTGGMLMTVLMYIFLYAPIIIMIVFSFNDSKSRTIWAGFTLRWYQELFRDDLIMSSLQTTIAVSVLASLISAVVGTYAAIGLFNMKKNWRKPLLTVNNIPVVNADIITGVSLALLFVYYLFIIVADSLLDRPAWRPDLIPWIPVLGGQMLGGFLLYRNR